MSSEKKPSLSNIELDILKRIKEGVLLKRELATQLGISEFEVERIISELIRKGYLKEVVMTCARKNCNLCCLKGVCVNFRIKIITLTPKGIKALKEY